MDPEQSCRERCRHFHADFLRSDKPLDFLDGHFLSMILERFPGLGLGVLIVELLLLHVEPIASDVPGLERLGHVAQAEL